MSQSPLRAVTYMLYFVRAFWRVLLATYPSSMWLKSHAEAVHLSSYSVWSLGSRNFSQYSPKPSLYMTPPEDLALTVCWLKSKPVSGKWFWRSFTTSPQIDAAPSAKGTFSWHCYCTPHSPKWHLKPHGSLQITNDSNSFKSQHYFPTCSSSETPFLRNLL